MGKYGVTESKKFHERIDAKMIDVYNRTLHIAHRTSHIAHLRDYAYILVAGYGWSGSSAAVDILHEFKTCYLPGIEFRVVKDPYGLDDLFYTSAVKRADNIAIDIAVKDFLNYENPSH